MERWPTKRVENTVHFNDGTTIDVFDLAELWLAYEHRFTSGECMNPECDRPAADGNVELFGVPVGRLCDTCSRPLPLRPAVGGR